MNEPHAPAGPYRARRPAAFRLEDLDDAARTAESTDSEPQAREPRAIDDLSTLTMEADDAIDRDDEIAVLDADTARPRHKGFSFGKLFVAAFGALVSIAIGLSIDSLIEDLFTRADWLGWTAVTLTALLLVGALGVVGREAAGLMQLAAVDRERRAALGAYESDSASKAKTVVAGLVGLVAGKAKTAEGRARLAALSEDVIDGRDMIALAEREILGPLDIEARALILASAKRVSVVTAVSPKAIVDISYVLFETVRLIRRMAELYGARPGTIGLVKLTRDVVGHLAVTGSISIGDGLVGQVVGHGIAAKLSARLGEGVVNGLLTARVGIAAMDLCRPLPFLRAQRPRIGDFVGDLTNLQGQAKRRQAARVSADMKRR